MSFATRICQYADQQEVAASTEVVALTKSPHYDKLRAWARDLSEAERKWFVNQFPQLIVAWFDGQLMGKKRSAELNIEAAKYHSVDALAVALFKLRDVYPVKIPPVVYRFQNSKRQVKGPGNITLTNKDMLKPLNSWTAKNVDPRKGLPNREKNPVRLTWKTNPKWVCGTSSMIAMLVQDMCWISTRGGTMPRKTAWTSARAELHKFRSEQEVMVYLPRGQEMHCTIEPYKK